MKTKIVKIDAASPDEAILQEAVKLLKKGGVIVCPTDTGYAFSANALDAKAVAKVFHLKGRVFSNPIHIAVSSIDDAGNYARMTDAARYLAARYLPGALTMVLKKKENIPAMLVANLDTVGIRVPENDVMLRLVTLAGFPLTATSANISGKPGTYSIEEVKAQLGENLAQVPLVLDQGPINGHELSTIIDMTVNPPELIRQGKISWLDIRETYKMFQTTLFIP